MGSLNFYKYSQHFGRNFQLAYPVMLSQLGHVMVGVADSVMVGQIGAESLAAAALANVIFHVLLTFGIGVSYAITPLVAVADGEGNIQKSAEVLKHGTVINFGIGIIITLLVFAGSEGLHHLDQPVQVVIYALPYLKIITLSIIPFMLFQSARQFAEGLSHTKQAMYFTVASNVLNVGLNYLLIFGKFGFPEMGLLGAGIATLISRTVMAIAMWVYLLTAVKYQAYIKSAKLVILKKSMARQMLRIGLPAGLQFIFEVGAFGMSTVMIGWLGTRSLAAHQIAINMASISYMMASGLSATATIRVGNQLGKKDIRTLRDVAFSLFVMVGVFMTFFAIVFISGRFYLPSLYISDQEVIGIASSLLILAGVFQISDGIQVVGLGSLRGLADVKVPTIITFIAYWVIGLPVGYILGFKFGFGVQGVWYGFITGLSVAAVLLFIRFNHSTKKLAKIMHA